MESPPQEPASHWHEWVNGRAGAREPRVPAREPATVAADEASWVDATVASWDDEAAEPGEAEVFEDAAADPHDEFGIELRWPTPDAATTATRPTVAPPPPPPATSGRSSAADQPEPAATSGAGTPGPLLPFLTSRIESIQSLLNAIAGRIDAQEEATASLFQAMAERVDALTGLTDAVARREVAAPTDVAHLAPAAAVELLASDVAEAIDALRGDVIEVRDELAQLRRRLPVRAKRELGVDDVAGAVRDSLDQDALASHVADIVLDRLLAVVDVQGIDEPPPVASPASAPDATSAFAPSDGDKRRRRRPLSGR